MNNDGVTSGYVYYCFILVIIQNLGFKIQNFFKEFSMTDSKTKTDKNDAVEKSMSLSIGQQLRAAREAQGLSIEDVARQLLLSKQLVGEIENDDYRKIAAPVYVNGYLRSYAQLLKIPIDLTLAKNLKQVARTTPDASRKIMTNVVKPKTESKANFFAYVVVAVFTLLVLLWWRAARVHTEVTPAAINNTMTEIQLPSAQPQLPETQPMVLPQDNNPKITPQPNELKVE